MSVATRLRTAAFEPAQRGVDIRFGAGDPGEEGRGGRHVRVVAEQDVDPVADLRLEL